MAQSRGVSVALFAGQGVQQDLRRIVEAWRPHLVGTIQGLAGGDPFARQAEGTRWMQPAVHCGSLALWAKARALSLDADVTAAVGHSLGEVAALVAGGVLDEQDSLGLVCVRGVAMQEAASSQPDGPGGMVAVQGPWARSRAGALAEAHGLLVVNDNGPEQVVLAGPSSGCASLIAAGGEGLRIAQLPIAGAFHTPAMRPAAAVLRRSIAGLRLEAGRVPVFSAAAARPFRNSLVELASNLHSPVRWDETIQAIRAEGAERWLDCSPGGLLGRIVARLVPGAVVVSVDRE